MSAAAYTRGQDSRKAQRDVKRYDGLSRGRPVSLVCLVPDEKDQIDRRDQTDERRVLELGGKLGAVRNGDDSAHDGVNAAEVGVSAWSESGECEGAVGEHEAGVEGAVIAVFQAAGVGDGMFRGGGVFPLDWRAGRDGDRLRHKVGGATLDNDGGVRGRRCRRPGREQSHGE